MQVIYTANTASNLGKKVKKSKEQKLACVSDVKSNCK